MECAAQRTCPSQSWTPTNPECHRDRQPIRALERVAGSRGCDGNKKVNGRKRHLLLDTLGFVLSVCVHDANMQDRAWHGCCSSRSEACSCVCGWCGRTVSARATWQPGCDTPWIGGWRSCSIRGKVGEAPGYRAGAPPTPAVEKPKGFVVLRRRRVVDWTFGWLGRSRRSPRDFEVLPSTNALLEASSARSDCVKHSGGGE